MSSIRIEVDVERLAHQSWKRLPWRYRWLQIIPGVRRSIETEVAHRMRGSKRW